MLGTPSLLRLLQVQPVRGRIFTEEDGEIGKTQQGRSSPTRRGSSGSAGRTAPSGSDVRINGEPLHGRRRAAAGLQLPRARRQALDAGRLHRAKQKSDDSRHSNNWSYVARLKPGATVEQARQQIDALNARNLDRFPQLKQILINAGFHTVVVPLQDHLVREVRGTLYLLWGGVVFVLLVGARQRHQPDARALERADEGAGDAPRARRRTRRASRGSCSRRRCCSPLAGGALGLALGYAGVRALAALSLDATPQGTQVAIDGRGRRLHLRRWRWRSRC